MVSRLSPALPGPQPLVPALARHYLDRHCLQMLPSVSFLEAFAHITCSLPSPLPLGSLSVSDLHSVEQGHLPFPCLTTIAPARGLQPPGLQELRGKSTGPLSPAPLDPECPLQPPHQVALACILPLMGSSPRFKQRQLKLAMLIDGLL